MDQGDSAKARADAPLQRGDDVLVRGRVMDVFGDELLVTFEPWWPPWSGILIKRERATRVPLAAPDIDPGVCTPVGPVLDRPR